MSSPIEPPNFAEELAKIVIATEAAHGFDREVVRAKYESLYLLTTRSMDIPVTFMAKPMVISWPEGEPPVLKQVLEILVRGE